MLRRTYELAAAVVMGVAMLVVIKLFGVDPDDLEWD
jgi:hypothetical protein